MKIPEFISDMKGKVAKLTDNITSGKLRAIEGSIERLKQMALSLKKTDYYCITSKNAV